MTILQPLISKAFEGKIWRLLIDADTDIMAVEIRNEEDKQTSFASISLASGEVYFDAFTLPERWLTGIEAIHQGVLLLHYYKHETSPEHKGIIAVDAITANQLWSNYNLAFDHLSTNGAVVYNTNIQPKKLSLINVINQHIVRPFNVSTDKPIQNHIVVPDIKTASEILPGILPEEPYGNMVFYVNHNSYIIVSLHTFKNGLLQQHLYIIESGNVVYHDLLNYDIQKLQPEAFVLHKNALVYIKNKAEIKVLKL